MSYQTPHFDLPFRFITVGTDQKAATVEQDTVDDVANCVLASLLTHTGQRPEVPSFGAGDLTFKQQPLDASAIIEKVTVDEPRASLLFSQQPNALDVLIDQVVVSVSTRESNA